MPVTIGEQFRGLPMNDLHTGPMKSAHKAQESLAKATTDFIKTIGFQQPDDPAGNPQGGGQTRTVTFQYEPPVPGGNGNQTVKVEIKVLLPAGIKEPLLDISAMNVTFDMEVQNSERLVESTDAVASPDVSVPIG